MKKAHLIVLAILFSTLAFAQKREKIKGSKIVTVAQKEVESFDGLEVEDNIEVFLVKGDKQGIEIEADENLHDAIKYEMYGTTLRIYTSKEISGAKKLSVRVTYAPNLKTIVMKHETILNALADLELENIAIKNFDFSKSFLNVKSTNFSLILNDKTTAELNLKAQTSAIELSKNATLKALIACQDVKLDLYQKTTAVIEGDAANVKLRLDNNATFTGQKFTVKNMELVAESYTTCNVTATENISIFAAGKTVIQLFGTPKVDMKNFADSAILYKKEQ
jgi:hypothetical protein